MRGKLKPLQSVISKKTKTKLFLPALFLSPFPFPPPFLFSDKRETQKKNHVMLCWSWKSRISGEKRIKKGVEGDGMRRMKEREEKEHLKQIRSIPPQNPPQLTGKVHLTPRALSSCESPLHLAFEGTKNQITTHFYSGITPPRLQ